MSEAFSFQGFFSPSGALFLLFGTPGFSGACSVKGSPAAGGRTWPLGSYQRIPFVQALLEKGSPPGLFFFSKEQRPSF